MNPGYVLPVLLVSFWTLGAIASLIMSYHLPEYDRSNPLSKWCAVLFWLCFPVALPLFVVAGTVTEAITLIQGLAARSRTKKVHYSASSKVILSIVLSALVVFFILFFSQPSGDAEIPQTAIRDSVQIISTIPVKDWGVEPYVTESPIRSPEDFPTFPSIEWTTPPTDVTAIDRSIVFVSLPGEVYAGSYVSATIQGAPNTRYYITVTYSSGNSEASGLYPKYSDSEGYVTWGWIVGGNTYSGSHSITVTGGGETAVAYFTVK